MKIITKDILTVESGMIFSQVNCQKVMGAGLAKQIRDKWPIVFDEYIQFSNSWNTDFERLGQCNVVKVKEGLFVVNCFGQLHYGKDKHRYTDYAALNQIFRKLGRDKKDYIYFPYLFACGLAGGDWEIVSKMIDYYFPNAIICKLPEKQQCEVHTFVTKDKCGCK